MLSESYSRVMRPKFVVVGSKVRGSVAGRDGRK